MRKVLVYFCLTVYFSLIKADVTVRCPQDSVQSTFDNKICYLFVKDSKTFADAESFCNQKNGNLAAVTDQFINNFLGDEAARILGNVSYYWIGGTLITVKANGASTVSVWVWTREDSLMSFFDWDPTAAVYGNCIGVNFRSLWSAIDCNMSNPFVCEIPATIDNKNEFCDDGWTHFNFTHSCYKKFSVTEGVNQSAAEYLCIQKGGHLASIHSVDENRFIGELTSIGFNTSGYASIFWIGAVRDDESYKWRWLDKTAFDYAVFGNNYDYTHSFCVNYWPDFTTTWSNYPMVWNACHCDGWLYSYLCKKESYKS